jgi:hypothetical protein
MGLGLRFSAPPLEGKKFPSLIFRRARGGPLPNHFDDCAPRSQNGITRGQDGLDGCLVDPLEVSINPSPDLNWQVP